MDQNEQGGFPPINLHKAKKADFITFSLHVEGANCGNCEYMSREREHDTQGICTHKKVSKERNQPVTTRNCCKYWDGPETLREF